jgi:hypothetical protein
MAALQFAAEPLESSAAIDAAVVSDADATTSRRKRFIQLERPALGLNRRGIPESAKF